jgi:hypothetical protein
MTTFRSEDLLVGIIGLILLPLIATRLIKGLREGRLPLYRTYVRREEHRAKFAMLLGVHSLSFFIVAAITADLLLGLRLKDAL